MSKRKTIKKKCKKELYVRNFETDEMVNVISELNSDKKSLQPNLNLSYLNGSSLDFGICIRNLEPGIWNNVTQNLEQWNLELVLTTSNL